MEARVNVNDVVDVEVDTARISVDAYPAARSAASCARSRARR
jgi:hypothetical protein